jgi:hypothetical protein
MSLDEIVTVSISTTSGRVTATEFDTPLILAVRALPSWTTKTRTYTSADEVEDDFAVTTFEYQAAAAIFAAESGPLGTSVGELKIGRPISAPVQLHDVKVETVTHSATYTFYINDTLVTYDADSATTNDEIVTGLAAAVSALAVSGLTVTTPGGAGSTTVRLTGAAGINFAIYHDDAKLSLSELTADAGIAADLSAIVAEDDEWYTLVTVFNSEAIVDAAAEWIEARDKTYIHFTQETYDRSQALAGGTATMQTMYTAAYARTAGIWGKANDSFSNSAWAGVCLPFEPGTETWAYKQLSGVDVSVLTPTEIDNIGDKNGNYYTRLGSGGATRPGKTYSGLFIDFVRWRDKLRARIQEAVAELLLSSRKVPYTDEGIAMIENRLRAVLNLEVASGAVARTPEFEIFVPLAADVASADKTARILRDVTFTATYTGAIHKVIPISGTVEL